MRKTSSCRFHENPSGTWILSWQIRTLVYAVECPIQNCQILALMYGWFFGNSVRIQIRLTLLDHFPSALLTRHLQAQGTSAQRIGHIFLGKMYAWNQKNSCNQLRASSSSSSPLLSLPGASASITAVGPPITSRACPNKSSLRHRSQNAAHKGARAINEWPIHWLPKANDELRERLTEITWETDLPTYFRVATSTMLVARFPDAGHRCPDN